jgi:ABC-type multidrug transport system fused ATPase/permease subunit
MKSWWLSLAVYASAEKQSLVALSLLMVIGIALTTLTPWPMKLIVDYALVGKPLPQGLGWAAALPGAGSPEGLLGWLAGTTVLLYLAARAVNLVQSYVETGVGTRMVYRLGADLFDHIQRLSLRVHSQQRTGDLVDRITADSTCARDLVLAVLFPFLTSTVSVVTVFVVMWNLDRRLSLLALLAAAPLPFFMKVLTPRMKQRAYEKSRLRGQLMAHVEQTLTALPVVQAFGREAHGDKTFRSLSAGILRANLQNRSYQMRYKVAVGTPTAIGAAAIMVLGGLRVLQGSVSVGSLLVFLAYLDSLYRPIASLAYLSTSFAFTAASARRVLEILEADVEVREAAGAKPIPTRPVDGRGHVRFENVTFGYDAERAVLRNVTFEARPGEKVAIVGPTGAGKSTLVSLISRLFDPWEGRVIVDGMDVREATLGSLRSHVAVVLQEPFLLPVTIAENIAYGRLKASRDEVVAAAVAANADGFIRRLPHGYETVIGERGATLSGGEKQRIAIARALLKDAPILILDEPTSALDASTEALFLEALDRLMHGRTTFIIAHRFSTIRSADKILVLDAGEIVETGTHAELVKTNTLYNRYYKLQIGLPAEWPEPTHATASGGPE